MATTFTANPTSGISPGVTPDPDTVPILNLPSDGDAANVASVLQAFKQSVNETAWLKAPRSTVSAWIQALRRYKSALLHTRFGIDHHGFPAGRIQRWSEDWMTIVAGIVAPVTLIEFGSRWFASVRTDAGASILAVGASSNYPSPRVVLASADVGDTMVLSRIPPANSDANTAIAVQWDHMFSATALVGNSEMAFGLAVNISTGTGAFSVSAPNGAAFVKRTGDTNWQLYTRLTGAAVYTDTGVAAATTSRRRFRLEVIGATVSDDSTARVLAYIDGALVANVATSGTNVLGIFARLSRISTGAGGSISSHIGILDFASNLWPTDVFI